MFSRGATTSGPGLSFAKTEASAPLAAPSLHIGTVPTVYKRATLVDGYEEVGVVFWNSSNQVEAN